MMFDRRKLLLGISNAALMCGLRPADAAFHGSMVTPTGQFFLVASASGDVVGNEYPFANFMKGLQFTQVSNYTAFVGTLNNDGYPQSTLANNYSGGVEIPPSLTGPGTTWVFKWTGKAGDASNHTGMGFTNLGGTIISDPGGVVQGSTATSINVLGTSGRITFTWNQSNQQQVIFQMSGGMVTDGSLTNIVLCPLSLEAVADANGFNPTYINSVKALNPRALRIVNWNAVNSAAGTNLTQAAGLIPATALTYWPRFVPSWWSGSASGINTYTATPGSGITSIVDGTTTHVVFTSAGSVSGVTLALSGLTDPFGTTNIPILDMGGGALATNAISAGQPWTLIYDATLKAWLGVAGGGGNRDGIQTGVPLSAMIALCNALNVDLYYNIPPHLTDADLTTIVTTIKNGLNSNLTAWFEISDEIWNFGYDSTSWFRNRGTALGWAHTSNDQAMFSAYALKFRQWSAIIKSTYGAQANYKRLLNFQAFGNGNINDFLLNGKALGPQQLTITGISASATTPTVTTSGTVQYIEGQQVSLTVSGTGAIGALNGTSAYVHSPSGNTFELSSTPPEVGFTPISTAGGTFSSGSCQTLYSANGGTDYTSFPNRPVDWADGISYATYYYGAQLRWIQGNTGGDSGYLTLENAFTINAATLASSVQFQTSTAHGYATGDRVQLNSFTGTGWSTLNGQSAFVTVIDATHFTIPISSSGFPAYSGNGGNVSRYADIMTGLIAAGANYASGSTATAISWLDGDIRAGTLRNGNVASETVSSLNSATNGGFGVYPTWEATAAGYDTQRVGAGMPKLQVVNYEGGMQGLTPTIATLTALGYTSSQTVTLNTVGTNPAFHKTAHGYQNGFRINFSGLTVTQSGGAGLNNVDCFVMNATANDFDVSTTYYNQAAVVLSGTQSGTITATADLNGLDNLLDGYKNSAIFQATVKFQFDNYFAQPHSYLGAWYELATPDNWSLYPYDIYGTPFKSYTALSQYHFP